MRQPQLLLTFCKLTWVLLCICCCTQAVLSAQLCDVTAATALKDTTSSCRVLYNSAAYLSTIAHRLAIPVEVQHGGQYCYPLPAAAGATPRQHCQVRRHAMQPHAAYRSTV